LNHCLKQRARPPRLIPNENRTPRYVADIETRQREGGTTSSPRKIRGLSVLLDPPHPRDLAPWEHPHIRFGRQLAAPDCSSDYSASALYGERTIDGHPEQIIRRARLRPLEALAEHGAELVEPRLCAARATHNSWLRHSGFVEQRNHVGSHELQPVAVDEIAFRKRDDGLWNSEKLEDQQVFASLGHHSLVGGNDEETKVDAAGANQHAADEVLVTRNIDYSDRADPVKHKWRESKVDRDSAPLFLRQSVRVDSG
jgi:hypothetical protein